jgi:ATP/maltotriose-dependent transcriptional regulator MalT
LRCVLLVGEAGVGKTRLATEFVARARPRPLVLSARGYLFGGSASFGLWAEALEGYLRTVPAEEVVTVCGGFLDDLAGLLRSVAVVRGSVPEREPPQLQLLQALAVALSNLARQNPVIVVLDDVHLADSSSWEALSYLVHNLPEGRLFIVAAARPMELADHPFAPQVLPGLEQEALLQQLPVQPLDAAAVGELAAGVVGGPAPQVLVDWLSERSRGNPLFALGLLQALIDEKADLAAPVLRRIPEALADCLRNRLSRIDEPGLATLEMLAVLGRRAGNAELAAMSNLPRDLLDETLSGLLSAGMVLEEWRGRELTWEIGHPLIQQAIYQRIRDGRRRALHRLVGRSLLASGRPGDAAPHFTRSADPGDLEAIEALREALRQAEQRETEREALEILGALAELVPSGDPLWADVAAAMSWRADWVVDHQADNTFLGVRAMREMSAVLARSPDLEARATISFRLASFLAWGTPEIEEADRVCREAVELFERTGNVSRTLLARNALAAIKGIACDLAGMEAEGRRVVEEAQRHGERGALMQACTITGSAATFRGRFEEAEAVLRLGLAIAAEDGKLAEQTWILSLLAILLAHEGRMQEALDAVKQAKGVNAAALPRFESYVHWMRGDNRETLVAVQEGVAWKPVGTSKRRGLLLALAALSGAEAGELDNARAYATRAKSIYEECPFMFFSHYASYADAVVTWREGKPREALAVLGDVTSCLLEKELLPFASPALVDLVEVAVEVGDTDAADKAAADLADVAQRLDRNLHRGLAALAGATASLGRGAVDEAAARAQRAITLLSGLDYPGYLGRAHSVLGRSLLASDRTGAIEALEQAAGTFDGCGAAWRLDEALATLRALRGRGRRAAGAVLGPASLTRREREVACLASHGLTARKIAERLCIGERTVEGHLASIYAKLRIRSKFELVRRASDLAL